MNEFFEKLLSFGDKNSIKKLEKIVQQVNALEDTFEVLPDEALAEETELLKERYELGESLDRLLPEAFALVREASKRALGMRHFDVQIMGGAALHFGMIAEIKTGEGKTLVATLAAFLNSLTGNPVHIITVNEYLAKYQSELMGRVYSLLGLKTGCLSDRQMLSEKQEQYSADIIYGTSSEFGFDYLRDNLAQSRETQVQTGLHYCIIDEIDSILIDDARTPLIVSGRGDASETKWYLPIARAVKGFIEGVDYEVDLKKKTVGIHPVAIEKMEKLLKVENLYAAENSFLVGAVQNAVRAKALYRKNDEYIVTRTGIELVDENTGRVLEGRRYSDGLHQAIEAKEGIAIKPEDRTYASVTLQNYFRMYKKMSGMTGTAKTEANEFYEFYRLGTVVIPTHKENIRKDYDDVVFFSEEDKFAAVIEEIVGRHAAGQPVLVGTGSVEKSEYLSRKLKKLNIPHNVLNAKDNGREAEIVAQAGRLGAITISTNMAGRGTDIMLGGNAEMLASIELKQYKEDDSNRPKFGDLLEKYKEQVQEEGDKVREVGGLCVIGTERHEAKRIDNQLRGRAGRQGDPGESMFLVSVQDELIMRYGNSSPELSATLDEYGKTGAEYTKIFNRAQKEAEAKNREERRDVVKYDNVIHGQRVLTYSERQAVLDGSDLSGKVVEFTEAVITELVTNYVGKDEIRPDYDLEPLWASIEEIVPLSITLEDILEESTQVQQANASWLIEEILSDARIQYQRRETEVGQEVMREIERGLILSAVDKHWQYHIHDMEVLRENIGYRSFAQTEPHVAYQAEGNQFYADMVRGIREDVASLAYRVDATSASQFRKEIGKVELLSKPQVFKLGDSAKQRSAMPTSMDYEGNLIEAESYAEGSIPMNRAERRAAEKERKRNSR
jgi:preprotein translocase subunit SecA